MITETVSHHPSDELLTAYSAGNLPLSQALCVATHLEYCSSCRQTLRQLDAVGSTLMQEIDHSPVSEDLKADVMAHLDELTASMSAESTSNDSTPKGTSSTDSMITGCLHHLIDGEYQSLDWKRLSSDICSVELCRDGNGAKVELLKIKPGGSAATHTHTGDEYTVILKGSFSDEQGLYTEGDFLMRSQLDHHTPIATQNSECICLAVTEGPVRLTGFFSRLLNPLLSFRYA